MGGGGREGRGRILSLNGHQSVYASGATIDVVSNRFVDLDHCDFRTFEPGDRIHVGRWAVKCCRVPHAPDDVEYPTVGWKLTSSDHRVV